MANRRGRVSSVFVQLLEGRDLVIRNPGFCSVRGAMQIPVYPNRFLFETVQATWQNNTEWSS